MRLVKATEVDSPRLIKYYQDSSLSGHVLLKLLKKGSFFSQYKIQSDDFVTYMLVDDDQQESIQAIVSLVFRKAWIKGREQVVGYATDLRVSPQRKVILTWSHHLLPTLQAERQQRDCKYIFSVVAEGQSQAYNAFIRPRSLRRELPRYYLFRKFDIVSVHGRLPFAPSPLATINTRFATPNELNAIGEYVEKKMKSKILNYNNDKKVFLKNLERWQNLEAKDFLLAVDHSGQIVGCTALWSSRHMEELIPIKYDSKVLTLKEGLHFLSFFGFGRRLSPINEPLNFRFLSFLLADNPDIFYSLLYEAYHRMKKNEFVVYPHFEGTLLTQPPRSFLTSHIKCGLYCVLSPEDPVPDFLKPKVLSEPIDFELAFL